MKASAQERIPAAKVGWLIILLTLGWVILFLVPWPIGRKEAKPPASHATVESKLKAVGLTDNVDWEGLPEYFTVWADKLEWENGKTWFAYWNPASKSYSYYFEAVREKGGYHFRVISRKELRKESGYEYTTEEEEITDEPPEVTTESLTHPFLFLSDLRVELTLSRMIGDRWRPPAKPDKAPFIRVNVNPTPLTLPKPIIQDPEKHGEKNY